MCVACVGQTCCPHLLPCSPILYMYICAHVYSCMHTYTQSPDSGPPCCWQRVLCSDTDPGCDTPHCTAGLASLMPTEAQGSTLDHAGISDMVTQSIAKPIQALPPLFSPDSRLADSDHCELALCQIHNSPLGGNTGFHSESSCANENYMAWSHSPSSKDRSTPGGIMARIPYSSHISEGHCALMFIP